LRKLMVLAAMLAMMLVAAAPAFAQDVDTGVSVSAGEDVSGVGIDDDDIVFSAVAQNIIGQINVTQTQTADADAIAVAIGGHDSGVGASATAEISQSASISVHQTNWVGNWWWR
jgi:hypothetical protein